MRWKSQNQRRRCDNRSRGPERKEIGGGYAPGFEDGGKGRKARDGGGHWELKKAQEEMGGMPPADTVTLAQ